MCFKVTAKILYHRSLKPDEGFVALVGGCVCACVRVEEHCLLSDVKVMKRSYTPVMPLFVSKTVYG